MKKSILFIFFIIALFLTGCGDKSQALDPTKDEKKVEQVEEKPDDAKKEQEADSTIPDKKIEEESLIDADEDGQKIKNGQIKKDDIETQSVYFDFDKFNIRADMQPVVEDMSSLIKKKYKDKVMVLEGNCDEWGTDEYNYALGLKRAKTVKDTLIGLGADKNMFKLKSYGESNPACSEKTEKCWSSNRRVEFKIFK